MLSNQELTSSTRKELLLELENARTDLMKTRITVKTKHNKDTSAVKKQKTYIARIMTALNELDMEERVKDSKSVK